MLSNYEDPERIVNDAPQRSNHFIISACKVDAVPHLYPVSYAEQVLIKKLVEI